MHRWRGKPTVVAAWWAAARIQIWRHGPQQGNRVSINNENIYFENYYDEQRKFTNELYSI